MNKNEHKDKKKKNTKVEYIFAIVTSLIWYYIINHLSSWHISFLSDKFVAVLWVLNLSVAATILGNLLLLLYESYVFRAFVKMIVNIFSFVGAYTLYIIYPFNFESVATDEIVRIILLLAVVGSAIAVLVEFVKVVKGTIFLPEKQSS